MKKKLLVFLTVFVLVFSISIPAFAVPVQNNTTQQSTLSVKDDVEGATENSPYAMVFDEADVLSEEDEIKLEAQLEKLEADYSFGAYVLTINSLGGVSSQVYADDYFDYNGLGYGENRDGCILLISITDRKWYISTHGYGITAFTDAGIEFIGDQMLPDLKNGEWSDACFVFATQANKFVKHAQEKSPYDVGSLPRGRKSFADNAKGIAISLAIALVLALIVTKKIKSDYKPVKFSKNAAYYLANGSLQVSGSYDNFITSNVSRTAIESDKSSGGGSSTHTSSSGSSHGGGGGSF